MQNLSWIGISMNGRGQWRCEYTASGTKKPITKTYPRGYRRYEALCSFKNYLKEKLKKVS